MGRCPQYLNVDDFDTLANSVGVSLTDDGAGAIGEVTEYIAAQILHVAGRSGQTKLDFASIVAAAE